uniref:Uncharacterized protein MANES_05G129200 n=1 Tax=Rhizophora mucronata TaxID=61149 RepID=A0A2P2KFP3_RHIMU
MEDTEMLPDQDLPGGSAANSTDVNVHEQQPTTDVVESQRPVENHQTPTNDSPSDIHMTDAQGAPNDNSSPLHTNTNNAGDDQVPEKKRDEHVPVAQNQPELVTPLPHRKLYTPKAKHESGARSKSVWTDIEMGEADESGTPEERAAFMKELETFHRDNALEFKPPKFYGEPLNCLKLWRAVIKLGGYEVVTASKLWRQVGESFHPPKTCTTVSWTFRIFYEKALLEYERHKRQNGELQLLGSPLHQSTSAEKEVESHLLFYYW